MKIETFGPLRARVVGADTPEAAGDPVVVLLHGFGAPGDDLVSLHSTLSVPPKTRFVFPEAPRSLEDMGMAMGRAWWLIDMARLQHAIMNGQIRDLSNEVPEGMSEANAQVNAFLDEVQSRFQVSGSKLVLGGFSQGAMLSLDVALRSDRALGGLILWSGTLLAVHEWEPLMVARKGMPVVQSHGTIDPILPYQNAERLRDHLTAAGWAHEWIPFMGQHQIPMPAIEAAGRLIAQVS